VNPGSDPDAPPPFLGSWGAVYAAVLAWLGLLVVGFRLLTRWLA
jgi:hypothetical protein